MKQMKTESIVKQSLVAFALAGLTFGVVACGDDSSSSAPAEEPAVETSLTGVVFGSDYTTGELRWIGKDGKISKKSLEFYQDSMVMANGGDLYVLERMGADNISKVNPDKLESDGKDAVVWQVALDGGANPVDMAFDKDNAWVALQNADSLVKISTKDGKISKSIKTGKFAYEGETSPYVADIELNDGKLYVLIQRYTYDAATYTSTYPLGLLAIYDAKSGDLKDTVQLKAKNPTAMAFFDGALYVASNGEYNLEGGTDADENRGIEKVNLDKKTSEIIVTGEKLGGGISALATEGGVAYVGVYKAWGNVPLVKVDLAKKEVKTIEGVADAEGSIAVMDGVVFVGDRSMGSEKVYKVKDSKASSLKNPKGALPPYSIALF